MYVIHSFFLEYCTLVCIKLICRTIIKSLIYYLLMLCSELLFLKTIRKSKEKFLTMRDDTRRDRMAAEIEIKVIRLNYFTKCVNVLIIFFYRSCDVSILTELNALMLKV